MAGEETGPQITEFRGLRCAAKEWISGRRPKELTPRIFAGLREIDGREKADIIIGKMGS
jgi:hypothetical protein